MHRITSLVLLAACCLPAGAETLPADLQPIDCRSCEAWVAPQEPFLLAPNTWYVGSRGLSAVLVDSGAGLVLFDGGLPQSAPGIATRIRRLGFRVEDIRYIFSSHAHFDHAGGIAALARWSGAEVLASPVGAASLRRGDVDAADPQAGFGDGNRFPPVATARGIEGGTRLSLGDLNITIHHTPGHAPGSASYSWSACDASRACLRVVYADSLSPVAAPGYRFSDAPQLVAGMRQSIARVAALECDVVVSTHPEFTDVFGRWQRGELAAPGGCRAYAGEAETRLEQRLASERSGASRS